MEQENKPLFIIDNDPIVDWPVIVKLPVAGGTFGEYQFTVSMHVLSPKEYEALFEERAAVPVSASAAADSVIPPKVAPLLSETVQLNVPAFQRLITGWQDVNDRDGNAVAYTPEKLAEQVTGPRGPALSAGLWRAISEVHAGKRLNNVYSPGVQLGN